MCGVRCQAIVVFSVCVICFSFLSKLNRLRSNVCSSSDYINPCVSWLWCLFPIQRNHNSFFDLSLEDFVLILSHLVYFFFSSLLSQLSVPACWQVSAIVLIGNSLKISSTSQSPPPHKLWKLRAIFIDLSQVFEQRKKNPFLFTDLNPQRASVYCLWKPDKDMWIILKKKTMYYVVILHHHFVCENVPKTEQTQFNLKWNLKSGD